MTITTIETVRPKDRPNVCFVHIHTDEGLVGLGESYFGAAAVDAHIHESVAPALLGRRADERARLQSILAGYLGRVGSGVEARAAAAVDLALWDLAGQAVGRSLVTLLGGKVRDSIPVYNTCAGSNYVRGVEGQRVSNWGVGAASAGPYEDLAASLADAGGLARSLLDMGIGGMKIWPFDPEAEASQGHRISRAGLDRALDPVRRIRDAVGEEINVMIELHSLWDLPQAERIADALEPYGIAWLEDPLRAESAPAIGELRRRVDIPIACGESLGTPREFLALLESGGVDVVIADVAWARGISAMAVIAGLAALHERPIAFHDCTGPVTLAASAHLALATPNAFSQEIVRASLLGWYRDLVVGLPTLEDGRLSVGDEPGIGVRLRPEVLEASQSIVRRTTR